MDFNFRGGTMGTVVGERIAHLFEEATARHLPCIIFTASGGARMEEGMLALMQLAKTTEAVQRFKDAGNFYHQRADGPTTGGVSASFAFQADVIVAEPRAAIGFAGRSRLDSLRNLAAKRGLQADDIVFTGYISDLDMVALYNLCTGFVFPSWYEGFGLPPLEAMHCGAPVIASDCSSLPEVWTGRRPVRPAR